MEAYFLEVCAGEKVLQVMPKDPVQSYLAIPRYRVTHPGDKMPIRSPLASSILPKFLALAAPSPKELEFPMSGWGNPTFRSKSDFQHFSMHPDPDSENTQTCKLGRNEYMSTQTHPRQIDVREQGADFLCTRCPSKVPGISVALKPRIS